MNRQNWLHESFSFLKDIREKHWLRRHNVSVVNNYLCWLRRQDKDYADENFEGFSQILKEQSSEKMYLGVLTNPIAIV